MVEHGACRRLSSSAASRVGRGAATRPGRWRGPAHRWWPRQRPPASRHRRRSRTQNAANARSRRPPQGGFRGRGSCAAAPVPGWPGEQAAGLDGYPEGQRAGGGLICEPWLGDRWESRQSSAADPRSHDCGTNCRPGRVCGRCPWMSVISPLRTLAYGHMTDRQDHDMGVQAGLPGQMPFRWASRNGLMR